ncbi:MAG TPA: NAD(P)H-dependent glycerol-3-phosphate dehydrogenase [Burkholderiales bacterium]|jgi:glycerol-3-phosphate dehydrogenase (NAD(P)+)|nr:NAD(P)H-dependent glycerol-3-phosphate dehydrogenase [Burkholderiales bacterium]
MTALAVLGAGAWGTALAAVLSARHEVRLWARDSAQAKSIAAARRNERYLPEIGLPAAVVVTGDWRAATAGAELALVATPVAGLREVLGRMDRPLPFLWLCKGFEEKTSLLPHEIVAASAVRSPCGALSGPSFALEVARGLPCALTLASADSAFASRASAQLHGARLRIYTSDDVLGVEIGGAVKNVLAIAVGICDGLKLGENARAALVTRGLAELARLGVALGARAETVMGLTGAGDLVLTATGGLSRNRRVGLELARGRPLAEIVASLGHVAEGVRSARATLERARASGIELPITTAVAAVLEGRLTPPQAVELLLSRDPRSE